MNPCRAVLAIGVLSATCAIAPLASADGDPTAGNALYQAHCASCHGDPSANQFKVLTGANNPGHISDAIAGAPDMMHVLDLTTLTFANLTDIAAYLQVVKSGGGTAPNYQGLWWVAGGTENFWGINFAHQGDLVFGTWYTYDTSGNAYWLSMLGNRTTSTSNVYGGDINVNAGPPFNNFVGAATFIKVGTGTLTFSDANNGTFDYRLDAGTGGSPVAVNQTKVLTRFDLGTGPQPTCAFSATANLAAATNYQDLWWAASGTETGWGINFAHQGNYIFATWYTYDAKAAGSNPPMWLSALLQRQGASNVYGGPLSRTSGPRFDNYKASDVVQPIPTVGSATVTFTNGNSATFNYATNGSGGLPAGVNQTKAIVRFPFGAGGTVCQ